MSSTFNAEMKRLKTTFPYQKITTSLLEEDVKLPTSGTCLDPAIEGAGL